MRDGAAGMTLHPKPILQVKKRCRKFEWQYTGGNSEAKENGEKFHAVFSDTSLI